MAILSNTQPAKVFEYFEKICGVPHGSKNTKIVSDLLVSFAKELGVRYIQDDMNNVIMFKAGSKGRENEEPVIFQGHMDMVCTKEPWCDKDMAKDGLDLVLEGDWLSANGTSLGADDGIAVSIALAIMADEELSHPPIEAIFTVDEEIGMDGAFGIDISELKGRRLINIDSDCEGVFTTGCAGGVRVDCFVPGAYEGLNGEKLIEVTVDGLLGGHSGGEINKGRGSANKLMARLLYDAACRFEGFRLCDYNGGKFDNVICSKATAVVAVPAAEACHFAKLVNHYDAMYKSEYASADPGVTVAFSKYNADKDIKAYSVADTMNILRTVFTLPQGVQEMSMDIPGLPQTSLNLGVVACKEDGIHFSYSIRSSITSQKLMVLDILRAIVEFAGGTIATRGMYPGWAFKKESELRSLLATIFTEQFGHEPVISATHGGLECGLFIEKLPGLDCVSIGADLRDIHSCAERVSVSSVQRLYELVKEYLRRC